MTVPGYQYPVVLDLAGGRFTANKPILLDHKRDKICGQSTNVAIEASSLVLEGFMLENEHANAVLSLADQGFQWQASIGAVPLAPGRLIQAGQQMQVNGQTVEGPCYLFQQWELGESSITSVGCDTNTNNAFPIAASNPGPQPLPAWAMPAVAIPINGAPSVHVPRNYDQNETVIECAMLKTIGQGQFVEKQFTDQENTAADKMGTVSIQGLFSRFIQAAGQPVPHEKVPRYEAAMRLIQASATPSTVSLPNVFANVLNKSILAQMQLQPAIHRQFVRTDSQTDFRGKSFVRLDGVGGLLKVNEQGEIKNLELKDSVYQSKLDTWGRMIGLSRKQMIDDDLGAFSQLPEIFGRAATLAAEQEFFAFLSTWFTGGNQNLIDGTRLPPAGHPLNPLASRALGPTNIASLQWALQVFRDQKTSQGFALVEPRKLMVPTSLEVPALQCMAAIQATQASNTNVLANRFSVDVSPFLTEQSPVDWYLFADPAVMAAVMMAFLNGQQSPQFESGDMEFSVVGGMRWKSFWDFGFFGAEKMGALKIDVV